MDKCDKIIKKEGTEKEVIIADDVTGISELAFAGSDGLESIFIPDSVVAIGNYAFMNCYSLREIRLPESIEHIGAGLFQNCWQLRSVKLPEGTIMLGTDMFENCHGLTELSIPASVTKIARTSFSGCRNLRKIHISPSQIDLLPASARYTAVMTAMEEDSDQESETDNEIIRSYVSERQKSFLDLAINRRSAKAVRYMLDHDLVSDEALREYLSKSASSGRTEITALILNSIKDSGGSMLEEDPFA